MKNEKRNEKRSIEMKKGPGVLAVYFEMLAITADLLRKRVDSIRLRRPKILICIELGDVNSQHE